ncbi:hypothetical protein ACF1GS_37140 [Streptomyces eurythermus]|uniref:hypothetical protein n=1 Tax=Streptomyces eurythermus TaxID=42237 RepID=UPI0036F71F63
MKDDARLLGPAGLHITPALRATLTETEHDELPDGSHETGVIEWVDYRKTAELPVFPPIGPALAALPAVTDENYTWL